MAELALFVCSVVWSVAYFFSKSAALALGPSASIIWRYIIGAICFLPFVRSNPFRNRHTVKFGLGCGFFLWLILLLMNYGLMEGTIANAGFILAIFVVVVPAVSYFFLGARFGMFDLGAIILSMIGLWFVTGGISDMSRGDLFFLAAAGGCTFHVLITEAAARKVSSFAEVGFLQCIVVTILAIGSAAAAGDTFTVPSGRSLVDVLYLGVMASSLCLWLQLYGQEKVSAWRSCLIFATEPAITAAVAWIAAGEQLSPKNILGGAFITAAIILPKMEGNFRSLAPKER